MTLPFLKISKQEIQLPDSKRKLKIRPYLTGEEKALLMAIESGDASTMQSAIRNLVSACVDDVDVGSLSFIDLEFVFIQLRKISVGNVVEVSLTHEIIDECDHAQKIKIDLDSYRIEGSVEKKILLDVDAGIGVVMRSPTVKLFEEIVTNSNVEKTFEMLYGCIEKVYDRDQVYGTFTKDELKLWVDQLTEEQLQKIIRFFDSNAKIIYDIEYDCGGCGKHVSRKLEGILNFL